MANNIISQKDKAKMFDYLKDYQDYIKLNFGNYDYLNQEFHKFISTNDIYLGSCSKKCKAKASKHQYFILFEQNKPRNNDNDVIHHLLRHIRNAIAHGRIKREDGRRCAGFGRFFRKYVIGKNGDWLFWKCRQSGEPYSRNLTSV